MDCYRFDGSAWTRIPDPLGDAPDDCPPEGWRRWERSRWEALGFDPFKAGEFGNIEGEGTEPAPLAVRFSQGAEDFAVVEIGVPMDGTVCRILATNPGAFATLLGLLEPWARLTRENARDEMLWNLAHRAFEAWHGHRLDTICNECDANEWQAHVAELKRRHVAKAKPVPAGAAP